MGKYALKLGSMAMALARPTSSSNASILMPRMFVKGYKDNVPKLCWIMSLFAHPIRLPRASVEKSSANKHKKNKESYAVDSCFAKILDTGLQTNKSQMVKNQSRLTIRPRTQRHGNHPTFNIDQASCFEHVLQL